MKIKWIGGIDVQMLLDISNNIFDADSPAWVAGSLVEGIGNSSSDVDVYIVVEELANHSEFVTETEQYKINVVYRSDRRIDYEMWSWAAVSELADKLDSLDVNSVNNNVLDSFSENEIDFIHRIFHSFTISNEIKVNSIQSIFDRKKFNEYMLENKRIYLDDAFDDTVGMLEEGHVKSAVQRGQYTLGCAVDMFLYSLGYTNTKEKHRITIFENLAKANMEFAKLFMEYWSIVVSVPLGNAQQKSYVKTILESSEKFAHLANLNRRRHV